ncbi:MAG: hypothetical protein ABSA96_16050 [Candidatus Acidiferrales bacterium]|jgi:hypothetical protein
MNFRVKLNLMMLSLFLAVSMAAIYVHADGFDQAIRLTFGQPVLIPQKVLPAGSYWFVLADHGNISENVIQVLDGDRKNVIATVSVGSAQVVKPSGHIMLTLADRSPKPQALLDLTYPGREDGHFFEIAYSKQERAALAEYPKVSMKVGQNGVIETTEDTK